MLADEASLAARLDSVEEIVSSPGLLQELSDCLQGFSKLRVDLDHLLSGLAGGLSRLTAVDPSSRTKATETSIGHLLNLRASLEAREAVIRALHGVRSPTFRAILMYLSDPELEITKTKINKCLNEDLATGKGALSRLNSRLVRPETFKDSRLNTC
ncbi:unnamed protein product [Sympodiomycopsis kandeliae]